MVSLYSARKHYSALTLHKVWLLADQKSKLKLSRGAIHKMPFRPLINGYSLIVLTRTSWILHRLNYITLVMKPNWMFRWRITVVQLLKRSLSPKSKEPIEGSLTLIFVSRTWCSVTCLYHVSSRSVYTLKAWQLREQRLSRHFAAGKDHWPKVRISSRHVGRRGSVVKDTACY